MLLGYLGLGSRAYGVIVRKFLALSSLPSRLTAPRTTKNGFLRTHTCLGFLFKGDVVVSQNKGTPNIDPNTIILIIGTPQKGTPNFGKPPCRSNKPPWVSTCHIISEGGSSSQETKERVPGHDDVEIKGLGFGVQGLGF